jgi:hypothetical protein
MNQLYGDQTPKISTEEPCIHYLSFYQIPNPKNPMMDNSFKLVRVMTKNLVAYNSVEELLSDKKLLPPNTKGYSVDNLKRHVMIDSGRSLGVVYPEYDIVAYSGASVEDRPIAALVGSDGIMRYYATPDFSKLVKQI